ncbi:MAG: 4Fe-4S binding protein [Chloroflexota bacterium]|nr:4Fe-4S binding protein [Chloroflexota bacterium]
MHTRDCDHISGVSFPSIGEAGRTGDWRTARPVIDSEKCIPVRRGRPSCFQCWLYCPEAVIKRTIPVAIDLEYCKGCGICAEVCPAGAITMVDESSLAQPGKETQ